MHDIEDEIVDIEPKHKQAKKDIEDAEAKKEEGYREGFKAYSLAHDIEQAMSIPQTRCSFTEVVEDAEEDYKDLDERSGKIATATARLAHKEQPTSKESWMVSWFREHTPKAFAVCEKVYEKFKAKADSLARRKRKIFEYANELEQKQRSQDEHEKY